MTLPKATPAKKAKIPTTSTPFFLSVVRLAHHANGACSVRNTANFTDSTFVIATPLIDGVLCLSIIAYFVCFCNVSRVNQDYTITPDAVYYKHMHNQQWRGTKRAFTVVELIIVIVVIGVLVGLVALGYNTVRQQANEQAALTELKTAADKLSLYVTQNGWSIPADLSAASISQPKNATLLYYRFANNTKYCISARASSTVAYYQRSDQNTTPGEGGCDDMNWIAGKPLAFIESSSASANLSQSLTDSDEFIIYSVMNVIDTSTGWGSTAALTPSAGGNRVQLDMGNVAETYLRYRVDTSLQNNLTGSQSGSRTSGKHIAWLQLSGPGTLREYAVDKASTHTSGAITAGFTPWLFTGISTYSSASTTSIAAVVYKGVQDQATRQEILNLLAYKYGVTLP